MTDKNNKVKQWLKRELSPFYPSVYIISVLSVAGTVLALAFAYLVRYLVNSASQNDKELLIYFAVILLSIIILRIILQTISSYLSEKCSIKITAALRQKAFGKILYSNFSELERYHSGDFLTRLTSDVAEIASSTVTLLPAVLGMAIQITGAIIALFTLDWIFTVIFILGAIIVGVITVFFRRKLKLYHKQSLEADSLSRGFIQESILSTLTIKAYSAENKILGESQTHLDKYYRRRMRRNKLRTVMSGTFSLLSNAGFIFALIWCGIGIINGTIDYGSMLSIILLLGQLRQPVTSFSSIMPLYYAKQASAERLYEITELPKEILNKKAGIKYQDIDSITIENLTFNYGNKNVFSQACAKIRRRNIVCITGDSASGKSTLFKLLLCVYSPIEGEIFFEKDKEKLPLSANERSLFAYVPQGNFLFSGTIRENLLSFSEEDDTQEDIEEKIKTALKVACAGFVCDLPGGLDTHLSERGGGLSEGQIQRLAIARALISARPILLLDEATSALDEETERQFLQNLKEIEEKTILIVTHRPAALKIADRILHIDQGKIVEMVEKG